MADGGSGSSGAGAGGGAGGGGGGGAGFVGGGGGGGGVQAGFPNQGGPGMGLGSAGGSGGLAGQGMQPGRGGRGRGHAGGGERGERTDRGGFGATDRGQGTDQRGGRGGRGGIVGPQNRQGPKGMQQPNLNSQKNGSGQNPNHLQSSIPAPGLSDSPDSSAFPSQPSWMNSNPMNPPRVKSAPPDQETTALPSASMNSQSRNRVGAMMGQLSSPGFPSPGSGPGQPPAGQARPPMSVRPNVPTSQGHGHQMPIASMGASMTPGITPPMATGMSPGMAPGLNANMTPNMTPALPQGMTAGIMYYQMIQQAAAQAAAFQSQTQNRADNQIPIMPHVNRPDLSAQHTNRSTQQASMNMGAQQQVPPKREKKLLFKVNETGDIVQPAANVGGGAPNKNSQSQGAHDLKDVSSNSVQPNSVQPNNASSETIPTSGSKGMEQTSLASSSSSVPEAKLAAQSVAVDAPVAKEVTQAVPPVLVAKEPPAESASKEDSKQDESKDAGTASNDQGNASGTLPRSSASYVPPHLRSKPTDGNTAARPVAGASKAEDTKKLNGGASDVDYGEEKIQPSTAGEKKGESDATATSVDAKQKEESSEYSKRSDESNTHTDGNVKQLAEESSKPSVQFDKSESISGHTPGVPSQFLPGPSVQNEKTVADSINDSIEAKKEISGEQSVEKKEPITDDKENKTEPEVPKTKKERPVLAPGERLQYTLEFMLKFKDIIKKSEITEKVLKSVSENDHLRDASGTDARNPASNRPSSGLLPAPNPNMGMPMMGSASVMQRGMPPPGMREMRGMPRDNRMPSTARSAQKVGGRGQPMPMNLPPVKPLERSDNAFDLSKNKARTHYDATMKFARSILNKLTMTNFKKLAGDLINIEFRDPEELKGLVGIIFDKALEEGHFCQMYAGFCNEIKDKLPEFSEEEADPLPGEEVKKKKVSFKRCLLNKCQEEFERADRYDELTDAENTGLSAEEKANRTRRVRVRMLGITIVRCWYCLNSNSTTGNIKFIGELFAQKILNEKIMHECVKRLLVLEVADTDICVQFTIGKLLDREEARHYMDYYFDQMKQMANEMGKRPGGNRLKFMLIDTLELRKNELFRSWKPRRETTGPKTIGEIREEAAKEGLVTSIMPVGVMRDARPPGMAHYVFPSVFDELASTKRDLERTNDGPEGQGKKYVATGV
eukprot:765597-Hanusia_phi.AAC.2